MRRRCDDTDRFVSRVVFYGVSLGHVPIEVGYADLGVADM
jgi:hypothetical protein